MKIVERGDPYADDVTRTVRAVTQDLQRHGRSRINLAMAGCRG